MIPFKLIRIDFKRFWLGSVILISLIALMVAFGFFITLQERAIRVGSAKAADQFDLLIGGAGSEIQLVLSTVYLQPARLPLLENRYLTELRQNPLVAWAEPVALGDSYLDYPIIGTTTDLLTEHNKYSLAQGKPFSHHNEAIVGVEASLKIGDKIIPVHGQAGQFDAHLHKEFSYTVVGILPKKNNAWDKAIFIPIEAVWQMHGHSPDKPHDDDDYSAGTGHDPKAVSAIIVKPVSIAGAYQLRSQYKKALTQAVFPGEVLAKLYGTLGNIQQLLNKVSLVTQVLVAVVLIMIAIIYLNLKKQQIAVLRAFGASRHRIVLVIWLGFISLVTAGVVSGVLLGYSATVLVSSKIAVEQGFYLPIYLEWQDISHLLLLFVVLSVALLIPAMLSYRYSVASCFK